MSKKGVEIIKNIISVSDDANLLTKEMSIIRDSKTKDKQFSIRIPLKFAKECNINPDKDNVLFTLEKFANGSNKLTMELIKNGKN